MRDESAWAWIEAAAEPGASMFPGTPPRLLRRGAELRRRPVEVLVARDNCSIIEIVFYGENEGELKISAVIGRERLTAPV